MSLIEVWIRRIDIIFFMMFIRRESVEQKYHANFIITHIHKYELMEKLCTTESFRRSKKFNELKSVKRLGKSNSNIHFKGEISKRVSKRNKIFNQERTLADHKAERNPLGMIKRHAKIACSTVVKPQDHHRSVDFYENRGKDRWVN